MAEDHGEITGQRAGWSSENRRDVSCVVERQRFISTPIWRRFQTCLGHWWSFFLLLLFDVHLPAIVNISFSRTKGYRGLVNFQTSNLFTESARIVVSHKMDTITGTNTTTLTNFETTVSDCKKRKKKNRILIASNYLIFGVTEFLNHRESLFRTNIPTNFLSLVRNEILCSTLGIRNESSIFLLPSVIILGTSLRSFGEEWSYERITSTSLIKKDIKRRIWCFIGSSHRIGIIKYPKRWRVHCDSLRANDTV